MTLPDCNHAQTSASTHVIREGTRFDRVRCEWCHAEVRVAWSAADVARQARTEKEK